MLGFFFHFESFKYGQCAVTESVWWRWQHMALPPWKWWGQVVHKPLNPSILVTCFTASACWDKQNRMSGWKRNKPRIFLEFIFLCNFLRGRFMNVIVAAPLVRSNLPAAWVRCCLLAHSDRPVLCLMSKVQAVLSGYSVHLYPTSMLHIFEHGHMSA